MKLNLFFICLSVCCFSAATSDAQSKKFDTTVKIGDEGYRVVSNNKNADKNEVTVTPVNLKFEGTNPSFMVYGKITKTFTDDFNDDGRPDLIICVYSGDNGEIGTIIGIAYNADKTLEPIYFPDVYLDAKLRDGYKGHDVFSDLTGTLLRKFPIYLQGDAPDKPTGGIRTVQYKVMQDNGHLSFKVLRSYDAQP
jgi:hypothetical protein